MQTLQREPNPAGPAPADFDLAELLPLWLKVGDAPAEPFAEVPASEGDEAADVDGVLLDIEGEQFALHARKAGKTCIIPLEVSNWRSFVAYACLDDDTLVSLFTHHGNPNKRGRRK
jgi:hypothetical protein